MNEIQINLTPEQQEAIGRGEPVLGTDATHKFQIVVLSQETFGRLRNSPGSPVQGDIDPTAAYGLSDEVMKADWDDPKMAEYDDYEKRRP